MRTSSQDSLHRTQAAQQAQQASQEQRVQQAAVQNVSGQHQGVVEPSQLPRTSPPASGQPTETFSPSATLMRKASALHQEMLAHNADLKRPANLDQATRRMVIEGQFLQEHAEHVKRTKSSESLPTFEEVGRQTNLQSALFEQVQSSFDKLTSALEEVMQKNGQDQGLERGILAVAPELKESMQLQTDLFAKRVAHYEEVLNQSPPLSKEDREAVLKSELNFSLYATRLASHIPNALNFAITSAEAIIDKMKQEQPEPAQASSSRDAKPSELAQWEKTLEGLEKLQAELLPEFENSVAQAKLGKVIDELNESSGSVTNQVHAFTVQAFRQMALSGLALGAVNSFTDYALSKWPAAQLVVTPAATALAHDIGTHTLAAAILEVFGGATKPVKGSEVFPAPNKYVSENGTVRPRNEQEMELERENNKKMLTQLKEIQNGHALGSAKGDFKSYLMFFIAQGTRALTFSSINADHPGGATVSSMAGGAGMGGWQGAGGLRDGMLDQEGRRIPAFTMSNNLYDLTQEQRDKKATEDMSLSTRLKGVGSKAMENLNYLDDAKRKAVDSKRAGLTTGWALKQVMEPAIKALENSSPAGKLVGQAAAIATQSPLNLAMFWISTRMSAYAKAAESAPPADGAQERGASKMYERTRGLAHAAANPNQPANKQTAAQGSAARLVTNALDSAQAALNIPAMVVSETLVEPVNQYIAGKVRAGIEHLKAKPEAETTQPRVSEQQPAEEIEMQTSPKRTNPSHDASDRV